MAEHDDNRVPPDRSLYETFHPADLRPVSVREHEQLRKRVHDVSNTTTALIGQQHTDIRVLQRDVEDARKRIESHDALLAAIERHKHEEHTRLRAEMEERETRATAAAIAAGRDARKYASTLVEALKDELKEWRHEEKQERQQESNAAIARAAIWATVASAGVGAVVAIGIAIWK